jgi:hypothetical protein
MVSLVPRASDAAGVDAKPQCRQLLVHAGVHRQGKMKSGPFLVKTFTSFQYFNKLSNK